MSGYGVHSRQVFEWLYNKNNIDLHVECLNWGMTPWLINSDIDDGLIGNIMKCSRKLEPPYDITFQLQLPDEWNPELGKINIGMSAVVETDRCNPKWIDAVNKMSHVIVPSSFSKKVIKKSGITFKEIDVVHENFNKNILSPKDINFNFETDFNFLIISQLNSNNPIDDRKNIFNTIKWICEAFKDNPNVGIVLKTNSGKGTTIDRKITEGILQNIVKIIGKNQFPKIYLFHGNMSSKEVAGFYNHKKIKCLVSATRGEGYGLPLVDAGAAGMPVIATNWSGHIDFLGDEFIKVDYSLVPIRKEKVDNRIFFEGHMWADPDEKDFKEKIIDVYNNFEQHEQVAANLKEKIIKNFSQEKIFKDYDKFLDKVLG
jgi:glycosyltransferase involved in cell wall biosynthesis